MNNHWPKQSECDAFFGNPRGRGGAVASRQWEAQNLRRVNPPFKMHMVQPVTSITVHSKCAMALNEWLMEVWKNAGRDDALIKLWGMDVFSGSYCFRTMRGLQHLSMHAYGCAFDFDAPRNFLHDRTPHFAQFKKQVVSPFLDLGGTWGGDWNGNGSSADERRADGTHFQFASMG